MTAYAWTDIKSLEASPPPAAQQSSTAKTERLYEKKTIEHPEDLPEFSRKLYDLVGLPPSLKHRLCPIDVSTNDKPQRFAIVLIDEELHTDVTAASVARLANAGWKSSEETAFYLAPASVMTELARDAINENSKSSKGAPGINKEDSALWGLFHDAAAFALEFQSSDIHIVINRQQPMSQIKFRIDGRLTRPREFEIESMKLLDMVAYVYNVHSNTGSENTFNENQAQQCQVVATIHGKKVQFRWASNRTAVGTKIVMRVIPQQSQTKIRSLEELGYLPPQVNLWMKAISRLGGGTLVAGVVGSGKSTTMLTVMSMLPEWMAKYTVEDPVENLIPDTDQFSVSRALNSEGGDPFLAVKRQTKRMDPDAVMIGEIRDRESASLFRDIAESGHRAFSTVHAPSAIDMITLRLVSAELGIPRDVIATPNFINLLVYQALVPKLCECRVPATSKYDEEYLDRIERLFDIHRSRLMAENHEGCPLCRRKGLPELNGTKGRVVVAEMIEPTPEMLLLFRESKNLELKEYIRNQRTARFDEPDSTGKSALEVAMYHVARGIVDPKEVETKFGSFTQYEYENQNHGKPAKSARPARTRTIGNFQMRLRKR